jgi:hypothetical protein
MNRWEYGGINFKPVKDWRDPHSYRDFKDGILLRKGIAEKVLQYPDITRFRVVLNTCYINIYRNEIQFIFFNIPN